MISDVLEKASVDYVKWDMNRSVCDCYSSKLPAERQGEIPHRYRARCCTIWQSV